MTIWGREGFRGVASVAMATPFFRFYLIKFSIKSLKILCTVGYTNLKFLMPSLIWGIPWSKFKFFTTRYMARLYYTEFILIVLYPLIVEASGT